MTVGLAALAGGIAAYLLGAFPTAYVVGRLNGVDIRRVGSGNVGATNVFRAVGKTWGIVTFVLDALKGFIPAFVFPRLLPLLLPELAPTQVWSIGFAGCAVVGHNWPVFLSFKGGKGVATSAGALLGIAPLAVGLGLVTWIAVFALTRYVSVASIATAIVVPAPTWFLCTRAGLTLPIAFTLLGALIIWRHRGNIRRLLAGSEHRFDFHRKPRA
jgi:glycerol-3-phosphate acyltransferase PlsY